MTALVPRSGSSRVSRPRSWSERISRPKPCFRVMTAAGTVPTQVDYSDYREVNGVKVPFHIEFLWLDGREGLQFSEVKANTTIDAIVFGRPTVLEKTLKK